MQRLGWGLLALLFMLALDAGFVEAGQRRQNVEESEELAAMSVEELRAYQSYFYSSGGRDPLTMRFPTAVELGDGDKAGKRAPTIEEQEASLIEWLKNITHSITTQNYADAIKVATNAMLVIDNEWPQIKPEHAHLLKMSDDIRNYYRLASRLKAQQDIAAEFKSLRLKIDGIAWSPTDAKAVVNGKLLSAGEVMLDARKQGDLRVEMIEETGVVFQFKGLRFRVPVEIFSQLSPPQAGD